MIPIFGTVEEMLRGVAIGHERTLQHVDTYVWTKVIAGTHSEEQVIYGGMVPSGLTVLSVVGHGIRRVCFTLSRRTSLPQVAKSHSSCWDKNSGRILKILQCENHTGHRRLSEERAAERNTALMLCSDYGLQQELLCPLNRQWPGQDPSFSIAELLIAICWAHY